MMTERQHSECARIIHGAAIAAGSVGAFPIPGSDTVGLLAIKTSMVVALARVFNVAMHQAIAEKIVKEATSDFTIKPIVKDLSNCLPGGIGRVVRTTVAVGCIEAFGWEQARAFASQQAMLSGTAA